MAIADNSQRKSRAPGKVPLGLRLKAWWDGYDLEVRRRLAAEEAVSHEVRYERERLAWETPRIELAQQLWGRGFSSPGEAQQTRDLVKPIGLDESMSVLEIGAGLGGSARLIAQEFGSWVTALEPNAGLARAGAALSEMSGLSRKASISTCDMENLEIKRTGYDCILSRQALFPIQNKLGALSAIAHGLKGKGQLAMTELVRTDKTGRAFERWRNAEASGADAWSAEDYAETIKELGLDLRVVSDITDDYRGALVQGWSDYLGGVGQQQLQPEDAQILKEEAEFWELRKAAIDAGELKVYRFHALSTRANKLLSDW